MLNGSIDFKYGKIMAVPKRKTSKSRRDKRRSHHKIVGANVIEDKKTGEYKLSHHVDLSQAFIMEKKILDK